LIIADTSGLMAAFSRNTPRHGPAKAAMETDPGPVVVSPYVIAELDYILLQRAGVDAELQFLTDVAAGVYELASFGSTDVARAAAVLAKYRDMRIGLADASLVVLAERYDTTRILTLDERHFRAIRPLHADAFTLLPADTA
jgi:uncharacterized protein